MSKNIYWIDRPLWANNKMCPGCGKEVDSKVFSCETGLNYCSHGCANGHVKAVWDPTTESVRDSLSDWWAFPDKTRDSRLGGDVEREVES